MANKRDYELTEASSGFDNTYSIKTDKLLLAEAMRVFPSEIVKTGLGSVVSATLSSSAGTITSTFVKYYKIGDAIAFSFYFGIELTGTITNPSFTLSGVSNSELSIGQLMNCIYNIDESAFTTCPCFITSVDPIVFTVNETFVSLPGLPVYFRINGVAL